MSAKQFSKINKERAAEWHGNVNWSLSDWAVAATGELGEACNLIKKLNRLRDGLSGNDLSLTEESLKQEILIELADTVTYIDLLAQELKLHNNLSLWGAIAYKFNKVSDRLGCKIKISLTIFD